MVIQTKETELKKWYNIRARYMHIYKPEGKVLDFWLSGTDDKQITEMVVKKGYIDIEWVKQENPPFLENS